ncbi:MAG: T9SS type A sorting domain-containing protein, partial [Flavobacteriales bacterium]|nr:T9SS type A sorting domain-containing protein [Flavobacteriales bacterium]
PNVLSAWVMLGMDGNTDIEQKSGNFSNDELEKVTVYPNPTSGRIVIESDDLFKAENQQVSIEILDLFGRTVFTNDVVFTGKAYGFYLNEMPPGIYQLSLSYNNKQEAHSLVVKP